MYTSLFDYPRDFLVALCAQLLDLVSLATLDTALCNKNDRIKLLELLGSKDVSFSNSDSKDMKHQQLRWCALRGLRLKCLRVLGYRGRSVNASSEVVVSVAKNSGNALKSLHLQDYKNGFNALHFVEICNTCDIQNLTIERCNDVASLLNDAHLRGLKTVKIASCSSLTDKTIESLAAKGCSLLSKIDLSGASSLSDEPIMALARQCPLLEHMNLVGLKLITDVSIKALASHCPLLKSVNLARCVQITDESVKELAKHWYIITYTHTHTHTHTHIHTHIHTHTHTHTHIYIYIHTHTQTHTVISLLRCVYAAVCISQTHP